MLLTYLPSMLSLTSTTHALSLSTVDITEVDDPVILRYFETLNTGDFEATAELFADDGVLLPPFEEPVVGPGAIAIYLTNEAKGFTLHPQQGTRHALESGDIEFQIVGKVQTPLFTVNVGWQFILNPQAKILLAKIKLLASMKELLNLQQKSKASDGATNLSEV